MIPYKDENPAHHIPVITYCIIIINTLIWFFLQGYGNEPQLSESICKYGVIPGAIVDITWVDQSSNYCQVTDQSFLVILTSMFTHGGWMHLIGNMWFLWIFADNIEDVLRPIKFIIFYFMGGMAAAGAQILFDGGSYTPMVGASGAIGGVMGAYAWLFPLVRVRIAIILGFFIIRQTIPAWVMLGIWFGIQLISGYISFQSPTQGGIGFWAHIVGFLVGFLLVQLFYRKRSEINLNEVNSDNIRKNKI